jgi:uncharacterized protein (DUF302 family)
MSSYIITTTVHRPYPVVVPQVRAVLAEQGFGVLTEIDLASTLRSELGIDLAPQTILGACRSALAHQSLEIEPAVAVLMPCTVVVRAVGHSTVVAALDPNTMVALTRNDHLRDTAAEASRRITAALIALTDPPDDPTDDLSTDRAPTEARDRTGSAARATPC